LTPYNLPPDERDRNRGEKRDPWWYLPAAVVMSAALAFFVIMTFSMLVA
jgi:hypothetical protein